MTCAHIDDVDHVQVIPVKQTRDVGRVRFNNTEPQKVVLFINHSAHRFLYLFIGVMFYNVNVFLTVENIDNTFE